MNTTDLLKTLSVDQINTILHDNGYDDSIEKAFFIYVNSHSEAVYEIFWREDPDENKWSNGKIFISVCSDNTIRVEF